MAIKKTKSSAALQKKPKLAGLAAKPISRIQTAEGWRRSQLRRRKLVKAKATVKR